MPTMISCIYSTDPDWLSVLKETSTHNGVNFWRKDQRKLKLDAGAPFYFKIVGSALLAGRARFVRQTSMPIGEAWIRFGFGNGVKTENELRERAVDVLKLQDGSLLNCLLLDRVELLPTDKYVPLVAGEYPNGVMGAKYFDEAGISRIANAFSHILPAPPANEVSFIAGAAALEETGGFDPKDIKQARDVVFRAIAQRRGQSAFRQKLSRAYSSACAVTGTSTDEALEAAHIVRYQGLDTNVVQNGLLLRADWHTLFDLGYWTLSDDYEIIVSRALKGVEYQAFSGKKIRLPSDVAQRPSKAAIAHHRNSFLQAS